MQPRDRTVSGGPVEVDGYAAVKGTRIHLATIYERLDDATLMMGTLGLEGWQVLPVRVTVIASDTAPRPRNAARRA